VSNARARQDTAETAAFRLVPMHSGAELEHYDHSGRQGVVDALLHYPDGRTAALEVTSAAAEGQRQLDSLLRRKDKKPANPRQWTWMATVKTPRDLPDLAERAGRIILRCEALHITTAETASHLTDDPDFAWLLGSTVTLHGRPDLPKTANNRDRHLLVFEGVSGGGLNDTSHDFGDAIDELLAHDHVTRRARKLMSSGYDERHLFIMVDETALPTSISFALKARRALPAKAPNLPPGVTHLWLLVAFAPQLLLATVDGWQTFERDSPDEAAAD
jgi:hypothetical protein